MLMGHKAAATATSTVKQDDELVKRFTAAGWRVRWRFPQRMFVWLPYGRHKFSNRPVDVPSWGPALFSDGVLAFVNPNPTSC